MFDGKQLRQKLIGNDENRAVSPVIGVILMVAITVILAAVIAAFVMDLGGGLEEETQAGVTIEGGSGDTYTATWVSEGNANDITVSTADDSGGCTIGGSASGTDTLSSPGGSVIVDCSGSSGSGTTDTITATANGDAGSTVVTNQEVDTT